MMKKRLNKRNFDKVMNKQVKKSNELFKQKRQIVCCDKCGILLNKNEVVVIYDIEEEKNEYFCQECDKKYNLTQKGFPEPLKECEDNE